jgi:mono/diheme cytochrome c family protein
MRSSLQFSLAVFALTWVAGDGSALGASPEKGKLAFTKNGCWQCHGFSGQGGSAGLKLAPEPLALDALSTFIRSSKGPMPPYSEKVLSNDDVADIHAYLSSIPKTPDYKSIPLLNP